MKESAQVLSCLFLELVPVLGGPLEGGVRVKEGGVGGEMIPHSARDSLELELVDLLFTCCW